MTTCPQCGRVADDEIVCAGCGMSLALTRRMAAAEAASSASAAEQQPAAPPGGLLDDFGSEPETGESARDVRLWRLAALVCVICVLAATAAILLLHQHGSPHRPHVGLPLTTSLATSPATSPSSPAARATPTSTRPSLSQTATKSTAAPSRTKRPPTTSPVADSSTSAHTGSALGAHVARGSLDPSCGPHCYQLVVTLSGSAGGAHQVTCWSTHGDQLGSYTTASTTSSGCTDRRPRDSVYAIVDGRIRSDTVSW
jgi:hypothetical protein